MSTLTNKDMHSPVNGESAKKIRGHIHAFRHAQVVAASLSAAVMGVVSQNAKIRDLWVLSAVIAGSGESMTVDVLVNGTSILTSGTPYTIDATTIPAAAVRTQVKLPLDPAKLNLNAGDIVTVTRVYTAGGTPTPMTATLVGIEMAGP